MIRLQSVAGRLHSRSPDRRCGSPTDGIADNDGPRSGQSSTKAIPIAGMSRAIARPAKMGCGCCRASPIATVKFVGMFLCPNRMSISFRWNRSATAIGFFDTKRLRKKKSQDSDATDLSGKPKPPEHTSTSLPNPSVPFTRNYPLIKT